MELFDSHAHLQDASFENDVAAVLERAIAAGVTRILLPTSDLADSAAAERLASTRPGLYHSVGCHPHEASGYTRADKTALEERLQRQDRGSLLAVGEIGLDYHYDFSPRPVQQRVFMEQIDIAFTHRLPMIIHEREATADCLSILNEFRRSHKLLPEPGVFHCFSGSVETAEQVLDMGFCLGFDGPITFSNAKKALAVIRMCPHDRILIETDSPYLTPSPYRGQRNEPAYVSIIATRLAQELAMTLEEVARLTTRNACRCFGLDETTAPRLSDRP